MFETLAIFSCSLQCCFFIFSFFLAQRKADLHVGGYFYAQHTVATTEGHEVTPIFKSGFFVTRCQAKIKTKAVKNFRWPKKARIRANPEKEATRTAMADRLGRQKLKRRIWLAQVFFFAQEDH
jgi:hypothetical protein